MKTQSDIDLFLLLDSSENVSDEDYEMLKDHLADGVEDNFPQSISSDEDAPSRLGFGLYTDTLDVKMDLTSGSALSLSNQLRTYSRSIGTESDLNNALR